MKDKILDLIDEQKSPLFRIMSITNVNEPNKRGFENNISAFHIGNGHILSVAHNLRSEAQIIRVFDENDFQNELINKCNPDDRLFLLQSYVIDHQTNKRYLNIVDNDSLQRLVNIFKTINYDTRWVTQYSKDRYKPFLIIQFKNGLFYNDDAVTALFGQNYLFHEPDLNIYTFLIELELVEAFYSEDIALYKIINTDPAVISKMPFSNINYEILKTSDLIYCLQGSPSGTGLGRLFNEARIEGLLDQHSMQADPIGGTIFHEGLRYLLKGYFRFGSSGAPYFSYDPVKEDFEINAIQSEASPIQLSINNNMNGNFQYVNAIASPLSLIKEKLIALTQNIDN